MVFSVLFKLGDVIKAIGAMRLLVQFIGQAVGVMVLRRRWGPERLPFKMWLYPLPALLAAVLWFALFLATGWFALAGIGVIVAGIIVFMVRAQMQGEWPFAAKSFANTDSHG